jgi:dipeptidyl aminopeptidase/acylaminoacyl peptidase
VRKLGNPSFTCCVYRRVKLLVPLFLASLAVAQPEVEMLRLPVALFLELSPDASKLWYKLGGDWFEIAIKPDAKPKRTTHSHPPQEPRDLSLVAATRRGRDETSPDGKHIAYLGGERPYAPALVFVADTGSSSPARPISRMPISSFHWAADSNSLWVTGSDGADEPIGRLHLDGRFDVITQGAALRTQSPLITAGDLVIWIQSDGKHFGSIWVHTPSGEVRMLFDPNPQAAKYNPGTQEVVHWKNAHQEELQGILAVPPGKGPFPLVVDPYSVWRNRFLNGASWGNYIFVQQGYAVFFPDHRALQGFPANFFGEAYVGAAKDRDPVEVLADDVMTGVSELIRHGIADPARLYLYSSSTGASAIDQLLTTTTVFRAAVAHGGVADWLGYYNARHPFGDETIPGFLSGRTPADSPALYHSISPIYHVERIKTPLLLVVGENDQPRYDDTLRFYDALTKAGSPAKLVVYKGEGHQITSLDLKLKHVHQALDFFRAAPPLTR